MSARSRAERIDRIVADRARGLRWATIGARHGVSARQAQRLWKEAARADPGAPTAEDSLDRVHERLDQYEAAIEELALLSEQTKHDGVRLGAIRARVDVIERHTQLLIALGLLPYDLGDLRADSDLRHAARAIIDVLERHRAPLEMVREMRIALGYPDGSNGRVPVSA